jgi:oligopeptidase B
VQARWLLILGLLCSGCARPSVGPKSSAQASPGNPPIAPRHPKQVELHGDVRVDDYAWLRKKDAPEVLSYLRAENAYTNAVMKPTEALQEKLYAEFLSRIKQSDDTPPIRRGDYLYYSRTEEGKQYPIECRKHGKLEAPEEVILDLNLLSQKHSFLGLGVLEVSDDANLIAYSLDTSGFREYTLAVKDLRTGATGPEQIEKVSSAAWAADNRTLFYTVEDPAKRSYRLYRHVLGSKDDVLIYEEGDQRFSLDVWRSRSKAFVLVGSFSHTTGETRFIPANKPEDTPQLIAARRENHEYYVDHRGDFFYIRTNDRGRNFRIVVTPVSAPAEANWREIVPSSDQVMLEELAIFDDYYVLHEREDGVPQIRVANFDTTVSHRIDLPEAVRALYPEENPEASADRYRFSYESLTSATVHYDYQVATRTLEVVKRKPVLGGYDPAHYEAKRIHARAPDGTEIPISLVYAKANPKGPRPMLLEGYGAYGYAYPTTFSYSRVSLLDRGVIFGIAHVRGGGELGKRWHDQGRMLNKKNTFDDFAAAAEHLIKNGYTAPDRLAIEGASAGGLLIGAVLNQRPDLFRAALVDVPFVDVLNTMSDPSLPLTVGEYEEWGDPRKPEEYRYIASYCPYTNIRRQPYPAMLVRTSYNDSQVMYWEPAKYVAKLRAHKSNSSLLLFDINMQGGHGGSSGRYDQLHERAFDFAFLLHALGLNGACLGR